MTPRSTPTPPELRPRRRRRRTPVRVPGPARGFARFARAGLAALAAWAVASAPGHAQGAGPEVDEEIRILVENGDGAGAPAVTAGSPLHAPPEVARFYEARGFVPAWVDARGPGPLADSLLRAIMRADREGLDPRAYHLARIRALYAELGRPDPTRAPASAARSGTGGAGGTAGGAVVATGGAGGDAVRLARLDLLLTDGFLTYGAHLVGGRVDPVTIHPEWNAARREADLVALLDSALLTARVDSVLETLLPRHPGYGRLRDALARYRRVAAAGGWPTLPGRTLRPGMRDPAVLLLRERLRRSGDLSEPVGLPVADRYDAGVVEAVKRFQARHGLEQDGVAGLETNALLNVPVEERIRQIELNLERWRWLPRDLGARHVRVNIAGFEVDVVDGDSTVFRSRVMVGQRYRKTPVFSDRISYLVLNPTWTIPPNILEVDKLPLIREDPGYLKRNRIRVLSPDGREVDPAGIDWAAVTGRTAYRLRMDPGPENPLGQVKFMFPNPYFVYLHDTPGRELFDRDDRAFSSGCIRVERPLELAALLLQDAGWDRSRIEAALKQPGEQTVPLPRPVPIHILYWTAWVNPDGSLQLRPDIYDRDAALASALDAALEDSDDAGLGPGEPGGGR